MLNEQSQLELLQEFLEHSNGGASISETYISEGESPYPIKVTIINDILSTENPAYEGTADFLGNRELHFTCPGDQARSRHIEATITLGTNIEGNRLLIVSANVIRTIKVSRGYNFIANVTALRQHLKPAHRIFAEFAAAKNPKGWNSWYAPMNHSVDLKNLMLRGMDLSTFDLCCADLSNCNLTNANLSGANLSGANLDNCLLDGAVVEGADFFGVAIPARYESLVEAGGLLEKESIILL